MQINTDSVLSLWTVSRVEFDFMCASSLAALGGFLNPRREHQAGHL